MLSTHQLIIVCKNIPLVVTCDDPTPVNGQTNPPSTLHGSYLVGSRVTFSCDPGFLISGSSFSICQENQMWSHPSPMCNQGNDITSETYPNTKLVKTSSLEKCGNT